MRGHLPLGFPAFVQQPGLRRIGIIVADDSQRFARNEPCARRKAAALSHRAVNFPARIAARFSRATEFRPPSSCRRRENRLCKRSTALIGARPWRCRNQRHSCALNSAELMSGASLHQRRHFLAVMKSNPPEEPRIAENERALRLLQHKMIVFLRREIQPARPASVPLIPR